MPTYSRQLGLLEGVTDPEERRRMTEYFERKADGLRLARNVGVNVVMGSDASETKLHGANAAELEALVAAGFPAIDAIRAATVNAAKLLGMENELGAIEAGKLADLIGVRGDVLTEIQSLRRVAFVMKDGAIVSSDAAPNAPR